MFEWGFAAAFFLFATAVQALLAVFLVATRPRSEWAWVLATLFTLNAGISLVAGLREAHPGDATSWNAYGTRVLTYLDPPTSFLLVYLAFVFPNRPRAFQGRPGLLRALVLAPAGALVLWYALDHDVILADERTLAWFLYQPLPQATAWLAILIRWSHLLPLEASPVVRRQFQFVFAAFGIRAAHMSVLAPLHFFGTWPQQAGNWPGAQAVLFVAGLLGLAWAFYRLLAARTRVPEEVRTSLDFVLAFLAFGLVEALWGRIASMSGWNAPVFAMVDLFAVRPALVWAALVRHQLLGAPLRDPRISVSILGALGLAAFYFGLRPAATELVGRGPAAEAAALAGAAALALLLAAAVAPQLRAPLDRLASLGLAPRAASNLESYAALMEESLRTGAPPGAHDSTLHARREQLGITAAQHAALLGAIRSGWSVPLLGGDWARGHVVGGRYRVESFLGEGATGQAYAAHDERTGTPVVLKRTRAISPEARRVLLREAEALGRLDHPHIVRLLGTVAVGDEPVLVLERCAGGSLESLLEGRGRLRPREAALIAHQVLSALETAHAAGILHRDVKPSNVLFDDAGHAKLGDFGVAHVPPSGLELGNLTATTGAPGTLRYMSPEQVRGVPLDARSDLYSVGVLLYEMIAGHHPLPLSLGDFELRKAIVQGPRPGPPAAAGPRMRRVLERALARRPGDRFGSAAEFRHALGVAEHQQGASRADDVAGDEGGTTSLG